MSDFEDAAFYFESFTSPPKPKRKKQSKKDRKDPKSKNGEEIKTQEGVREKNKNPKFKETMKDLKGKKKEKRRNKNKEKKKKKNKYAPELDEFTFTQCSSTQAKRFEKLETPGKPNDSMKEGKRKKMVAFGSLPTYIRVKRPQFASSTPKGTEDVRENESCSQVSSTGRTQHEAQDDVQWNSDDVNSQDLFITQKTFRTSPSDTSSGEASDGVIAASPQVFTQKHKSQNAAEEISKTQEKTHECPQEDGVFELQQEKKISSQTKKEFKPSVAQQKKASDPKWMNPFLDEPLVINKTPEEHSSSALPRGELSLLPPRRANSSTQTENFFTSELSSYLNFCQKSRAAACSEDLKPLDLSLPQRVRKDLCLSMKMSVIDAKPDLDKSVLRGEMSDDRSKGVSANPQEKPVEVKKEPPSCEATPSPQSEADAKSADTTASSEDDHHARSAKKDLIQVGAVQLRLNKPFFFKTKGEWQSPRPESPLTKLSQGRDPKRKKCR